MTPEEKINYALSLVEGATPGPWALPVLVRSEILVIRLGTSITNHRAHKYVHQPIEIVADHDAPDDTREAEANSHQIALSPLVPAALRLAMAYLESHEDYGEPEVEPHLHAFLALLPEPPK